MGETNILPFQCYRCEKQSIESFDVYESTGLYLIGYPELQLIHVHFGESTHTEEQSVGEAQFQLDWVDNFVKSNPGMEFFVVNDMSRKDDSEFVEPKAKEIYSKLRKHKGVGAGAIYGHTSAMGMLINLLNKITPIHITSRATLEQAEADYDKWYKNAKK